MKMTIAAHIYPIILQNSVKEQLYKYYSKDNVKDLIKKINKEYRAIVKRSPEIGGNENIFISSYLMGAYLISVYKNTKNRISIDDFNVIISECLNGLEFMKKRMEKVDLLSESYKNKIEKAGEWCKKNKNKYPTNWQIELREKENLNFTHYVFNECALCTMCKNEGVPEFTMLLCATDYITMSFANCKLERPTTLGKGDNCCDFYITRL